jgi:hypothetical protein
LYGGQASRGPANAIVGGKKNGQGYGIVARNTSGFLCDIAYNAINKSYTSLQIEEQNTLLKAHCNSYYTTNTAMNVAPWGGTLNDQGFSCITSDYRPDNQFDPDASVHIYSNASFKYYENLNDANIALGTKR